MSQLKDMLNERIQDGIEKAKNLTLELDQYKEDYFAKTKELDTAQEKLTAATAELAELKEDKRE